VNVGGVNGGFACKDLARSGMQYLREPPPTLYLTCTVENTIFRRLKGALAAILLTRWYGAIVIHSRLNGHVFAVILEWAD
jgi:hypothetical protein